MILFSFLIENRYSRIPIAGRKMQASRARSANPAGARPPVPISNAVAKRGRRA